MGCSCSRETTLRIIGSTTWLGRTCSACRRTCTCYVSSFPLTKITLTSRTSAPSHDLRQRLVIQGFSDPTNPVTLSKLSIPLSPHVGGPQRPVGFMPSAASLAFHPVRCPFLSMLAEAYVRLRWLSLLAGLIRVVQSRCSSVLRQRLC